MITKKFTIQDVIDAAKKNGYPWIKGTYGDKDGACVIGQVALNLNCNYIPLLEQEIDYIVPGASEAITHYNDDVAVSYKDAAAYLENYLKGNADQTFEIEVKE